MQFHRTHYIIVCFIIVSKLHMGVASSIIRIGSKIPVSHAQIEGCINEFYNPLVIPCYQMMKCRVNMDAGLKIAD